MRSPFAKRIIYLQYQRHMALTAARQAHVPDAPIFVTLARKAHARIMQLLNNHQE